MEHGFPTVGKLRSPSCQATAKYCMIQRWDDEGMSIFSPERWLVRHEKTGNVVYDATAGPALPFGLRMRGCFGRHLAYIELKT
jgi:hypothetical protein